MSDVIEILRNEFHSEDGSFLTQLRSECKWDKEAYYRLTKAMFQFAKMKEGDETDLLERWVANGYWYLCVETPALARGFLAGKEGEYYRERCQRFDELAYWLFMGQSPYRTNFEFDEYEND